MHTAERPKDVKARPSIVVVGSSNTDLIARVERLPAAGETALGFEFATVPGGKGANQAVAAARAGGAVTFVGRVGRDAFGEKALEGLRREGIEVRYVARDAGAPSGVALIAVERSGQNSIVVAPGANGKLTPADVGKASKALRRASVVLLQLETPLETAQRAAEVATEGGARVILNPAPARKLGRELLELVFALTPNELEATVLSGIKVKDERSAANSARALRRRGARNVIITLGAEGVLVCGEAGEERIAGYKVSAVDTTGAGDVFNGALAVALGEGADLIAAARFANAAAAISVTRAGAQAGAPRRGEIRRLLEGRAHDRVRAKFT